MDRAGKNKLIGHGFLLFASTLLVNLGNYLINLLLGRWLGPEEFSEVGLLVTLMLMLSFIALAFQLTAAKYTAALTTNKPDGTPETGELRIPRELYSRLRHMGLYTGLSLAAVFILLAVPLQHFFRTSTWLFFPIFGAGMPVYLMMSINRGILQGREAYGRLALTYQAEMWSRLVLSVVAVKMGTGVTGIAGAITLSLVAALLVSGRQRSTMGGFVEDTAGMRRFLLLILVYECSQILINNSDTMLVKHFFPAIEAGWYAALALIGRIVYFGTWTVVTLLFPIVIRLEKEGRPHLPYFFGGLGVVAFLSGGIVVGTYLFPEWMVRMLFGEAYLPIAPFLWKYALATAFFTCANVFVYYNISLERHLPAWIMVGAGILQIMLIWFWHATFTQVIYVQMGLMASVILAMGLLQLRYRFRTASLRKSRRAALLIGFCLANYICQGQDALKPGFAMLESGRFGEATVFFHDYLLTDSSNRTALLCYGRAIGLSGNVPEAKSVFARLEQRYPGDFEIMLNAAEAFMWEKDFGRGKEAYRMLIRLQPGSFPANLGFGNAFASLRQYDSARIYINKALTLQPGNPSALLSLKYTRLGLADQYGQRQRYADAGILLEENLAADPEDKESLFAKGQLLVAMKEYDKATEIFRRLISTRKNAVDASLSLSYVMYLKKQKSPALSIADTAVALADTGRYLRARLGRVTALGWNGKFPLAFRELDTLEQRYPGSPDIQLKRGMLLASQRNFGRSLLLFKSVLTQVPSSFDANLGSADVLFAQELDKASRQYVDATLSYYPGQKDAKDFIQRLDLRHAPAIYTHDFRSSDKGGNISYNYSAGFAMDLATPLRLSFDFKTRDTRNKLDGSHARNDNYTLGLRWRIAAPWLVTAAVNETVLHGITMNSHLLAELSTEWRFARWHILELRYRRDIQNFTAGLINSNISMNNAMLTYNLSTPVNLGLYAQLIYSGYSDRNKRTLGFISLYYNILTDPVVKTGINLNAMHFSLQLPEKYFSPGHFKSYEAFASVENLDMPRKKWIYQALFAAGAQKIDTAEGQGMYRLQLSLGYRPVVNVNASLYYLHSNSAGSTVAGYAYSEWGIRARWVIMKWYSHKAKVTSNPTPLSY